MNTESQFDIAVVGAGPAGLAAAIRSRWVKSYRGVPCSTVICDPAQVGGLARLRSAMLTGPSFHLSGRELISSLEADRTALNIPLLSTPVDALVFCDERWHVRSSEGPVCAARAVILAPGMRRLANEAEFFNRGLSLTYNGYDYLPEALRRLIGDAERVRLLVIGNEKTLNLLPVMETLRQRKVELEYLLDEAPSVELAGLFGAAVHFGKVQCYVGATHLEAVEAIEHDGAPNTIQCERVFLDYNAFELKPAIGIAVAGLEYDERGFVKIDRGGSTNLPGLFAAGDATGLYAMAVKALSEGAVAGFSAYRYVFQQKFGCQPRLFAYAATHHVLDPVQLDHPELLNDDVIEILTPQALGPMASELGLNGPFTNGFMVSALRALHGRQRADEIVYRLLDRKAVTIQPREETRRGFARRP
ncbi:NAD(P)/FAD-dependent oxidoreductase [Myxococcota bacterium]